MTVTDKKNSPLKGKDKPVEFPQADTAESFPRGPRTATEKPAAGAESPGGVKKEESVAKEKKQSLARWAQERKLTRPRVAVLCNAMGWDERSKITEAELQAAINKHLFNKE